MTIECRNSLFEGYLKLSVVKYLSWSSKEQILIKVMINRISWQGSNEKGDQDEKVSYRRKDIESIIADKFTEGKIGGKQKKPIQLHKKLSEDLITKKEN